MDDERRPYSRQHEWRLHGPKRARLTNVLHDLQTAAEFAAAHAADEGEAAPEFVNQDAIAIEEGGLELIGDDGPGSQNSERSTITGNVPDDSSLSGPFDEGNLASSQGRNSERSSITDNVPDDSNLSGLSEDGNLASSQGRNSERSSITDNVPDDSNLSGPSEDGNLASSQGRNSERSSITGNVPDDSNLSSPFEEGNLASSQGRNPDCSDLDLSDEAGPILMGQPSTSGASTLNRKRKFVEEISDSDSDCDLELHFLEEDPEDNPMDPVEDPEDPDEPNHAFYDDTSESEEGSDSDLEDDDENFNFSNATLNRPVVMARIPSVREMLILDLALMIRHKNTYESLIDSFESKNAAFGTKNFPTSKKELWRILGRNSAGIIEHVYCSECGGYIAKKRNLGNIAQCPNPGCNFEIETKRAKYFVTLSLKKQFKHFLETPGMADLLNYRHDRTKRSQNAVEDVYDSEGYKSLNLGPFDYSVNLNTDGCKIRKGAKLEIYPVFLRLNELPPELRQKHIFLAAVYVDTKEPKMTSLMLPVVEQLNSLNETGVSWNGPEQNLIQSKIKVHCFCVDGKARYQVLNMGSHQGVYGCTYCTIKGVPVGDINTMRWPIKENPQIPDYADRTHDGMIRAMLQVHETLQPDQPPTPILGHKGVSPLMLLHDLDLRRSNACDDLHVLYECAAKHATELVLKEAPRIQPRMGYDVLCDMIDARLKLIRTPTNISRKPGTCSIKKRLQFKGSEWKNWIMYYAAPCLEGLIEKEYITPLELLSHGAFLLSQDVIEREHIEAAQQCFHRFLHLNEELYGIERTKLNLHTLIHFPRSVIDNGNLWCYSTFNFESWNHKMISKVKSPKGALLQIIVRHLILTSLELALQSEENISAPVREQLARILRKRRLVQASQFSQKVYLLGKFTFRFTSPVERRALEQEGFLNILRVQECKKILIGSTTYSPIKNVNPLVQSDNSMVYTYDNTFCTILSVIRFRCEDRSVCGLIVSEHSVTHQRPFEEARHVSRLLEEDQDLPHFILPENIRSAVVKIPVGGEVYVVPLPNLFEID